MPFISYNSDVVGDSSLIISYLNAKNLVKFPVDVSLTPLQKAHSTAIKAIVEDRMYFILLHYCFGRDFDKYMYPIGLKFLPQPLRYILGYYVIAPHALKRCAGQGISSHTDEERLELWKENLDALEAFLGDQPYMLGDSANAGGCGGVSRVRFYKEEFGRACAEVFGELVAGIRRIGGKFWDFFELRRSGLNGGQSKVLALSKRTDGKR
ncbi:hypothetical protein HK104_008098 [Borealophlyctis nickersoniae]|nr:hypothetical protein HK104_008098 [Borealophlyctis nickersoniae]